MLKIYFQKTNGNNVVIVTNGTTAKIFDGVPDGTFAGVDLYAEDAAEQLRSKLAELEAAGELNEYGDMYSPNECNISDIEDELEDAELVYAPGKTLFEIAVYDYIGDYNANHTEDGIEAVGKAYWDADISQWVQDVRGIDDGKEYILVDESGDGDIAIH